MRALYHAAGVFAALTLAGSPAHAGATAAYVVDGATDQLYRLDMTTLATELVGEIGVDYVYDIAAGADGLIAGQHDASPGFFVYDVGSASLVGQSTDDSSGYFDLDYANGRFYGLGPGGLITVEPMTASTTPVSNTTIPTNVQSFAMAGASTGFAQGYGDLGFRGIYSIDFDARTSTLLGEIAPGVGIRGIDYAGGVLYAMGINGVLYTVDQADASLTAIGSIGLEDLTAFTIVPPPAGLALLGVGACGLGGRRRGG